MVKQRSPKPYFPVRVGVDPLVDNPMSNSNFRNEGNGHTQATGVPLTKRERRRLKREQKQAKQEIVVSSVRRGRWGWWLLVLLIIVAAVYGLYKVAMRPPSVSGPTGGRGAEVTADDWRRGPAEAGAVLLEYSDFQCPACRFYEPWLQKLSGDFNTDLAVVYRHFPLRQTHLNADWSARAAEAAGRQGQFWEMHDLLFERQDDWAERLNAKTLFVTYADELKLDAIKFKRDLNSSLTKTAVEADYQNGLLARVDGTPAFFLNGQRIASPNSYEAFAGLIRQTIADSTTTTTSVTSTNVQGQ